MKIDLENLSIKEIEELVGQLRNMKLESFLQSRDSKAYLHIYNEARQTASPMQMIMGIEAI